MIPMGLTKPSNTKRLILFLGVYPENFRFQQFAYFSCKEKWLMQYEIWSYNIYRILIFQVNIAKLNVILRIYASKK